MLKKTKTITLKSGFILRTDTMNPTGYRVDQVTDSTEYTPGDVLPKSTVDFLCDDRGWKVTIRG